jgi:Flp pilus assembly pilin Flp
MPRLKNNRGQGMIEYVILITLMGIALIVTIQKLSNRTNAKLDDAATKVEQL